MLADPGPGSDFDFDTGDEITLEAWVNITEPLGHNRNLYVMGKGRTGDKRFKADNQNWALRIRSIQGEGRISFLFATPKRPGDKSDAHWHRWTSNQGFYPGTGWHRIAVAYTFGQPESMRGWLNDKPVTGKWDMGGATHEAPVVDDDAIWIGSTSGGNDSNSFRGLIDEVSIFRQQLTDQQMAARYQRVGPERSVDAVPEVVPDLAGCRRVVAVRLSEGLPTHDRWLPEMIPAQPTMEYSTTSLLFSRLPAGTTIGVSALRGVQPFCCRRPRRSIFRRGNINYCCELVDSAACGWAIGWWRGLASEKVAAMVTIQLNLCPNRRRPNIADWAMVTRKSW